MAGYLHQHPEFRELLRILESEIDIQAGLIEKDYWIMHVLHGLKSQGYDFELKGGTSLSKGYKIIERFSEDIDIHIKLYIMEMLTILFRAKLTQGLALNRLFAIMTSFLEIIGSPRSEILMYFASYHFF